MSRDLTVIWMLMEVAFCPKTCQDGLITTTDQTCCMSTSLVSGDLQDLLSNPYLAGYAVQAQVEGIITHQQTKSMVRPSQVLLHHPAQLVIQ